jgi:hypothetical protein
LVQILIGPVEGVIGTSITTPHPAITNVTITAVIKNNTFTFFMVLPP